MSWPWYCIEITVNLVEVALYLYLINSKCPPKYNRIISFVIALVAGATGLSYISFYNVTWIPDFVYELSIVMLYALLTRKGTILIKTFWALVGIALICATALIGISVGLLLPGVTTDVILREQSATRFQLLILCKLMQAILFFFLAARKEGRPLNNKFSIIALIFVSATSLLTVSLLLEYGLGPAPSAASEFLLIGASMSILVINLVVFVLYESLSKQAENNLKMQATLQQYDMLMHHYEEIRGIYDEMHGWRHDYRNHLQAIYGYLQLKKYEKLDDYLKELEKSITDMETTVSSGNVLIDAIISSKLLVARNQNIQTSENIYAPPALNINDTDMCILLGNLLDNAIEACQRITGMEMNRLIEIEIKTIKGHLHITVRNSTNGIVRMSGAKFLSVKTERFHGIGIRHIDEITSKYDGYVNRKHKNCVFETNIMLPLESTCIAPLQTTETV